MKRILINAPLAEEDIERLHAQGQVVAVDEGDISDRIADYVPFEAIIASAVIPLDGAMMDRLPGLQVIGRLGIGVDNIDLLAATTRGIEVVHTPGAPTESTAEHTIALIYALAKELVYQDHHLRQGRWQVRHERVGRQLKGLTIGLVGLGRIGRRIVELLQPLDLRFLAYDPYIEKAVARDLGVQLLDRLEEMLPQVDILTLHVPLNAGTRGLVDREALALLRESSWLINTSRGGVVDEEALIQALENRELAGAALDVFDPEPPLSDHPLFSMDNVIVTPHRAFYTREGLRQLSKSAVDQVLEALAGKRPAHLANPEVWDHALAREVESKP